MANTTLGARTGEDGAFVVTGVPAGQQTVRITRIGYLPASREVTVPQGGSAQLTVALTATATQLEGVVVTALGIEREERSLTTSVQSVSSADLTRAPDAQNLVTTLSG
ncbi:carboxypeptidase-like regulatory domain-containing protein, partial [Enterobacter kobei]|uniref:carboxypeptidase-like regulatory domain-containing protein n=1 Tax=Enterobacter kobei TaxID=208224 RepID=UPI0035BE5AF1